jgi:hypothetical protein
MNPVAVMIRLERRPAFHVERRRGTTQGRLFLEDSVRQGSSSAEYRMAVSWVEAAIAVGMVALLVVAGVAFAVAKSNTRVTWVLIAAALAVIGLGIAVFLARPTQATLLVEGVPGARFVGKVTVDGIEQRIEGTVPMEFTWSGTQIDVVVIPVEVRPADTLRIRIRSANFVESPYGGSARVTLFRLGASVGLAGVSEDRWRRLAAELLPERSPDADLDSSSAGDLGSAAAAPRVQP